RRSRFIGNNKGTRGRETMSSNKRFFYLGVLAWMAAGAVCFHNLGRLGTQVSAMSRAQGYALHLERVRSTFKDMETARDSYVLTGELANLQSYILAAQAMDLGLDALREGAATPRQEKNLASLSTYYAAAAQRME